jgi:hypothetical protein
VAPLTSKCHIARSRGRGGRVPVARDARRVGRSRRSDPERKSVVTALKTGDGGPHVRELHQLQHCRCRGVYETWSAKGTGFERGRGKAGERSHGGTCLLFTLFLSTASAQKPASQQVRVSGITLWRDLIWF